LAERRVRAVVEQLRLIGNLSNRNNYSYSSDDVQQMFGAIEQTLRAAKERFARHRTEPDSPFKLDTTSEE
jgi:hypothetical protein